MTPHLRRSIHFAAALALTGALAPAPPEPAADIKALAREQLKVIDEAVPVLKRLFENGRIGATDLDHSRWGRRRIEALRTSGAGKAELVAALESYLDQMKKDEQLQEQRKEIARASYAAVLEARYRRLEAEIWLAEEKAR
jgi:putative protein kinase ArgK-like GTPase of G3E family